MMLAGFMGLGTGELILIVAIIILILFTILRLINAVIRWLNRH